MSFIVQVIATTSELQTWTSLRDVIVLALGTVLRKSLLVLLHSSSEMMRFSC